MLRLNLINMVNNYMITVRKKIKCRLNTRLFSAVGFFVFWILLKQTFAGQMTVEYKPAALPSKMNIKHIHICL